MSTQDAINAIRTAARAAQSGDIIAVCCNDPIRLATIGIIYWQEYGGQLHTRGCCIQEVLVDGIAIQFGGDPAAATYVVEVSE